MVKIRVTDAIKNEARKLAQDIVKTGVTDHESFTGLGNKEENYYHGYLGELVFRDFLHFMGHLFEYKPVAGKSDHGDFILYTTDGGIAFADTKICTQPNYEMLMVPKKQFDRQKHDFYIGEKLVGDEITIWGYCRPEDLTERLIKIPTMLIRLDKLKDLESLLAQIRYK